MARLEKRHDLEMTLEDFTYNCEIRDLRKKTILTYEKGLKLFFKFLEEDYKIKNLEDVKEEHIKSYINFTKERGKYSYVNDENTTSTNNPSVRKDFGKKISSKTVDGYFRIIKIFFNYCYSNQLTKVNVVSNIKSIKVSRREKDEMTIEDFNKILKKLDLTSFAEYRDYIIIQLLMETGMRIGECLELKYEDIDLKNRSVFLSCDITKGRKDRYVFIGETMKRFLSKWVIYKDRFCETELLFVSNRNNKMSINNFEKNFKKYVIRAKIDKKLTPHSLRHAFGKSALLNGASLLMVSKWLGHTNSKITEDIYINLTTEELRANYQKFSPLENMKR